MPLPEGAEWVRDTRAVTRTACPLSVVDSLRPEPRQPIRDQPKSNRRDISTASSRSCRCRSSRRGGNIQQTPRSRRGRWRSVARPHLQEPGLGPLRLTAGQILFQQRLPSPCPETRGARRCSSGSCLRHQIPDTKTGGAALHQHQAIEIARPEAGEQVGLAPGLLVGGLFYGIDGTENRIRAGDGKLGKRSDMVTPGRDSGLTRTDGMVVPWSLLQGIWRLAASTSWRCRHCCHRARFVRRAGFEQADGHGASADRGRQPEQGRHPSGSSPARGPRPVPMPSHWQYPQARGAGSASACSHSLPVGTATGWRGAASSAAVLVTCGCRVAQRLPVGLAKPGLSVARGDAHPGQDALARNGSSRGSCMRRLLLICIGVNSDAQSTSRRFCCTLACRDCPASERGGSRLRPQDEQIHRP